MRQEHRNVEIGPRRNTRAGWRRERWALMVCVLAGALLPQRAVAQAPNIVELSQAAASGSSWQTPLRFQGEKPQDEVSLRVGTSAFYDDNVLARNDLRLSDEALAIDSRLGVVLHSEHSLINFDYTPFFVLYRQFDRYDRLNHAANVSFKYALTRRLILGLRDSFSYQNGAYPTLAGSVEMSGLTSPAGLNRLLFPYTTRTLSNAAGLDLTFVQSAHTAVIVFGGYNTTHFESEVAGHPLYNGDGGSGGVTLQYRFNQFTNLGATAMYQDTVYHGGYSVDNHMRSQIESVLFSAGARLAPTLTVVLFGGPQHFQSIGEMLPGMSTSGRYTAAWGVSLTKQFHATALTGSLQRSVADGGGLFPSIVDTSANFAARRRLTGRWEVDVHAGLGRADTSLLLPVGDRTQTFDGGITFTRPMVRDSVLHLAYESTHQLTQGTLPMGFNFDRNQVTIGFDFGLSTLLSEK